MAMSAWLRSVAFGLSAGLGVVGVASAQGVPAETPPSSYSGDQYVDSRGCVYVRVGSGVGTEWVPRVARDRSQVCGFQPSLGAGGAAAPDLAAAAGVTVIGAQPVAPAPTITAAAPPPTVRAPAPAPIAAPAPVVTAAPATIASGCPNLPAAQQPYFTGEGVRCGPQAMHPGDGQPVLGPQSSVGVGVGGGEPITGTPRSFALSAPPPGYRLAWDDGRLNPYRGLGTPSGEAQMLQVWTDEVPRSAAPVLIYGSGPRPEISYALPDGAHLGVVASSRAPLAAGEDLRTTRARLPQAEDSPAPSNEVRVGAGHRHVLAGTYAGQAAAAQAYQRLASIGLPARIGQVERQGQTMFVVMAGPYNSPQSLGTALLQTRNAGFPGAISRN